MTESKRRNIYFRQTPKEFKSARQTQVFYHINRNLAFRIFEHSKGQFQDKLQKINSFLASQKVKFNKRMR